MLVVVWLLAATAAVAVAWQGVNVVGDQVTDERPAPLAAADIEARLAETTTTTTASTSTTVPPDPDGSVPPGASPTTAPFTPPPAVVPPPTTSAPAPEPAPETRTYTVQGGTAALRFSPAGVTVVFATPADGFSVSTEPEHGNGVKVEFESESHESRIDGWWDGGPQDRVREEAED